jgi:hypothetical protein
MWGTLFAQFNPAAQIWYAVPLIVVISLVYGGTRHETLPRILGQAWRSAIWIVVFMTIIFAIVWLAGYGVA